MELKYATVLVVDDESMLLDIFREWLEEEHCGVLTARDGAAALQILRDQHVDVVVSDVRMPVMDGIVMLKNLTTYVGMSQNTYPPKMPKMIFISGFTDLEPREAYDLGVEVIMQKPIKRDQFVDAVRRTLRSREEMWAEPSSLGGLQRFRCEVLGGGDSHQYKSVSVKRESGLGRKSEQFADEVSLADHISISQPSHSALPDHVHGLDTLQRPPRTL